MRHSPLKIRFQASKHGFALVVTLSLMVIIVVIAVGMLSLGTVALRSSSTDSARNVARGNAKLAVMLALGELQRTLGDDRRISADASIIDGSKHPNVVGVWKSWSPKLADNPLGTSPNYATAKSSRFVSWLTSSPNPAELNTEDWANSGLLSNPVELFAHAKDGFSLSGSRVKTPAGSGMGGAYAWSVVQEATRTKINVAGPEDGPAREINDEIQAQARPALSGFDSLRQPTSGWNLRANRVISTSQVKLDPELWKGSGTIPERGDYTTQGFGLLTDVVNGGLKTDFSLGFELDDATFQSDMLGDSKNPFRAKSTTPTAYDGQGPLFRPMSNTGSVRVDLNFSPASTSFELPVAAVPTFDTLRSYYRTPFHMYQTSDGPTVFERGMDHVAIKQPTGSGIRPPGAPPPAQTSQTGYRPILDRVLFILSVGIGSDKEVRLVVTPVVTLWNPYNVALEIEGAVAFPWMDVPFRLDWTFTNSAGVKDKRNVAMSEAFGSQFAHVGHGRSIHPYFYAFVTPTGTVPIPSGQSIRFKPGEVRVFVPAGTSDVEFAAGNSPDKRTIALRPVDSISEYTFKSSLVVPMKHAVNPGFGFSRPMAPTDSVELAVIPDTSSDYPLSVGLEDATRAKASNPSDTLRGLAVCDVQTVNFARSGVSTTMKSPRLTYGELTASASNRTPFGLIETYHRVANDVAGNRRSDIVYTTNPRQPYVNRYITNGTFVSAPHYETVARPVSSLNEVMEATNGGRNAFYGESNTASGKSFLAFFEAPQSAMLSIAAFQNADLSATAFSSASQIGNSWASAYVKRNASAEKIPKGTGGNGAATYDRKEDLPVYDYSYLLNEALFDSFYFSGISSETSPRSVSGSPTVWTNTVAQVTRPHDQVLADFLDDPRQNPLKNPRMHLTSAGESRSDLKSELLGPDGCLKLAAYLQVDGSFNVNSTSTKAWSAVLSGLRGRNFKVAGGAAPSGEKTSFPRFRNPVGSDADNWHGFRSLTDEEIEKLAGEIVLQVKKRGPFLSLGEFVNRRIESSNELGLKGALQTAIDESELNQGAMYDTFSTNGYPSASRKNIDIPNTGVGIPGYLTQADVLQSIAPVMSPRSDTFTIRGYGEATDAAGRVVASAWCEVVVQRTPEYVDPSDPTHEKPSDLTPVNASFGRQFRITSFRYLNPSEIPS